MKKEIALEVFIPSYNHIYYTEDDVTFSNKIMSLR